MTTHVQIFKEHAIRGQLDEESGTEKGTEASVSAGEVCSSKPCHSLCEKAQVCPFGQHVVCSIAAPLPLFAIIDAFE